MALHAQPVANGIRTDHPIQNLPFVEDSHIPIEDPSAVAALGRHRGADTWGRYDTDTRTGQWAAYTTDPDNHDFAWLVRHHSEHGRSVLLYRAGDGPTAYQDWFGDRPLLIRAGGYWWDGTTWYRPRQVLSWASEAYVRRPVPHSMIITAADVLDSDAQAALGHIAEIGSFALGVVPAGQWRHDLAAWALQRSVRSDDALAVDRCVVSLSAPELAEATLLGTEEFAKEAGIASSTLRAYLSRDEVDLPPPQTTEGGRNRWARPVVRDWVEQRRRDPATIAAVLTGDTDSGLSPGLRRLWKRLTDALFADLWGQPASRRRWSRPHRTEEAVRAVAETSGWTAALHLESTVPFDDLAHIIENGVLRELGQVTDPELFGIDLLPWTARTLGWFIEYQPSRAPALFGAIIREAEGELGIPPVITGRALEDAIVSDSGIEHDRQRLRAFLTAALPPAK